MIRKTALASISASGTVRSLAFCRLANRPILVQALYPGEYIYTLDRTRISPLVPSSRQRGEIIFVLDWLSHCSHSSPLTHSRDIFFTTNSFRCPNILHFFVRYTPDCFLFPPARFLRARERCSSGEKIFEGKYLEVGRRARARLELPRTEQRF